MILMERFSKTTSRLLWMVSMKRMPCFLTLSWNGYFSFEYRSMYLISENEIAGSVYYIRWSCSV